MSGLIVGLVLRTPITDEFNSDAKFIATVYADHAWDDGSHAYPAVPTVARITGIHERTVQRYLRVLEKIKMLIPDGKGPRGVNKYRFPIEEKSDGFIRLMLDWGGTVPPVAEEGVADIGWQPLGGEHWVTPAPPELTNKPSLKDSLSVALEPDFFTMTVQQARALPTLRKYTEATGWFPGALSWKYVHDFLIEHNLTEDQIRQAASAWVLRGYRIENVEGILQWACDGVPTARGAKHGNTGSNSRTGKGSSSRRAQGNAADSAGGAGSAGDQPADDAEAAARHREQWEQLRRKAKMPAVQ